MKQTFFLPALLLWILSSFAQEPQLRHKKGLAVDYAVGYTGVQPLAPLAYTSFRSGFQLGLGTRLFKQRLHLGFDLIALPQSQEGDKLDWDMNGSTVTARGWHYQMRSLLGGVAKYYFTRRKGLNYLVQGGTGSFFSKSKVGIEEINDPNCRVLAERTYFSDHTNYHYIGGGVAWSTGWHLDDASDDNATSFNLELTIRRQWTGAANHMTLRKVSDGHVPPPNAELVELDFINNQTAETHRHQVGFQQRAQYNGWQFGLTLVCSGFTGGRRAAKHP